jgi:hypothetical protein
MSDEINLWCWLQGDELERAFPVSVKRCSTVSGLKEAIRAKKLIIKGRL